MQPLHASKGLQLSDGVFFSEEPSSLCELHLLQQSTFCSSLLKPAYIAFTPGAVARKRMYRKNMNADICFTIQI